MKKSRRTRYVRVMKSDFLNTFVLSAIVAQLEALGYSAKVV